MIEVCTQKLYRGVYTSIQVSGTEECPGVTRSLYTAVGMLMGTARGGDRHPDLHGVPLIALVLTNMVLVMVVSTRTLALRW